MRCETCDSDQSLLWAHNGGVGTHHWGDGEERECGCGPMLICTVCNATLLTQFGFIVLDSACFGHANDTLQ